MSYDKKTNYIIGKIKRLKLKKNQQNNIGLIGCFMKYQ